MIEAPNDCCCRWTMIQRQIQRCRGRSKVLSQTSMRVRNRQRKRISGIASPSVASNSSVLLLTMRNSGCRFLRMAMLSIVGTPTFSSNLASLSTPYSFSMSAGQEHGRRPEPDEGKPKSAARTSGRRTSRCAQVRCGYPLLLAGTEKFLVVGNYSSSHSSPPASRSVSHRNPGAQLSERNPEINRPTARGKSGREGPLRNPGRASRRNDSQGFQSPHHSRWRPQRT